MPRLPSLKWFPGKYMAGSISELAPSRARPKGHLLRILGGSETRVRILGIVSTV